MYFSNKKLEKNVAALVQQQASSWALIGMILDQVDREKYWARDARSFSEWMKSFAPRIRMNESSLWRYFSASRYYQKLRKDLNLGKDRSLARLAENVSAENLELLEKLERVVPKKEFEEVAGRVLGGDLKRNELRELWKTYRPILTGRTARGKNVKVPRVDPMDREQRVLQTEARALATLMAAGPEWTGLHDPHFYYPMREVRLPRGVDPRGTRFDMLAIARKTVESPVMLIAVEICSRIKNFSALDSLAPYCDRLWVALVGKEKIPDEARLPEFVGILRVEAGSLRVERAAGEEFPGLGAKTGDMVKELLPRLLRN
jgi:hypothetical protein